MSRENRWLYVDDLRTPPLHYYTVARTIEEAKILVTHAKEPYEEISLDHDMGEGPTGYDFLLWLEKEIMAGRLNKPGRIRIHTDNPVGRENMKAVVARIYRNEGK